MTRLQTMDKIQRKLADTFEGVRFLLVLIHAEPWRDEIEIHWTGGPEWPEVIDAAQLAICPMEIERPRLYLEPRRTETCANTAIASTLME